MKKLLKELKKALEDKDTGSVRKYINQLRGLNSLSPEDLIVLYEAEEILSKIEYSMGYFVVSNNCPATVEILDYTPSDDELADDRLKSLLSTLDRDPNNIEALFILGYHYFYGDDNLYNPEKAKEIYEKLVSLGVESCYINLFEIMQISAQENIEKWIDYLLNILEKEIKEEYAEKVYIYLLRNLYRVKSKMDFFQKDKYKNLLNKRDISNDVYLKNNPYKNENITGKEYLGEYGFYKENYIFENVVNKEQIIEVERLLRVSRNKLFKREAVKYLLGVYSSSEFRNDVRYLDLCGTDLNYFSDYLNPQGNNMIKMFLLALVHIEDGVTENNIEKVNQGYLILEHGEKNGSVLCRSALSAYKIQELINQQPLSDENYDLLVEQIKRYFSAFDFNIFFEVVSFFGGLKFANEFDLLGVANKMYQKSIIIFNEKDYFNFLVNSAAKEEFDGNFNIALKFYEDLIKIEPNNQGVLNRIEFIKKSLLDYGE